MDKLAREAMLARKAHMTYGKWKAMQPIVPKREGVIPEGWRKCKGCGKVFKPRKANNVFCEIGCRTDYYYEKYKESQREKRKESKMAGNKKNQDEDICGKLVDLLQSL